MSVREVPAGPWSPPIVYSWYQEAELKSFSGGSVSKESTYNAETWLGSIPRLGRSPGEGNGSHHPPPTSLEGPNQRPRVSSDSRPLLLLAGPPLPPLKAQPKPHLLQEASDFWPPQLWENALLCVKPPKFVVICYSSHRKLIQAQRRE